MAKRKHPPKLPNGYGTIRYLGPNRRHPYAVHPPTKIASDYGDYVRPPALCYVDDWYVGFAVLNAYHAGTYKPGDELAFAAARAQSTRADLDGLCARIAAEWQAQSKTASKDKTFAEVYDLFYEYKFGEHATKQLSESIKKTTRAAYQNCAALHDRVFRDLRHADLQAVLDACPLKAGSISKIAGLIKQMYRYAMLYELCDKDYSAGLRVPANDDEHGVPFSDADLAVLWTYQDHPDAEFILIMCYSGYRVSAYKTLEVNLQDRYFKGGIKTASSKDRIVPIHSAIYPLVVRRLSRDGQLSAWASSTLQSHMDALLSDLGIERHTPHDCRHTFSRLCETYGVSENDRKRMMGHSFGSDITNGIYGHRTVEELRSEIEKIQVPPVLLPCD